MFEQTFTSKRLQDGAIGAIDADVGVGNVVVVVVVVIIVIIVIAIVAIVGHIVGNVQRIGECRLELRRRQTAAVFVHVNHVLDIAVRIHLLVAHGEL